MSVELKLVSEFRPGTPLVRLTVFYSRSTIESDLLL